MSYQPLSLRFNLKREDDRRAWELLQTAKEPMVRIIVSAVNAYFSQEDRMAKAIALAIRECLQTMPLAPPPSSVPTLASQDEASLVDSVDAFLAG